MECVLEGEELPFPDEELPSIGSTGVEGLRILSDSQLQKANSGRFHGDARCEVGSAETSSRELEP